MKFPISKFKISPGVSAKTYDIYVKPNISVKHIKLNSIRKKYKGLTYPYFDYPETKTIWDDCISIWETPEPKQDLLEEIYDNTMRELTAQIDKEIMEKLMKVGK